MTRRDWYDLGRAIASAIIVMVLTRIPPQSSSIAELLRIAAHGIMLIACGRVIINAVRELRTMR